MENDSKSLSGDIVERLRREAEHHKMSAARGVDPMSFHGGLLEAAAEIERLRADLAEAQKDTARLDWLEADGIWMRVRSHHPYFYLRDRSKTAGRQPLRLEIDAAMEADSE